MKRILEKLKEQRQIEVAKSILESAGYKVEESDRKEDESEEEYAIRKGTFPLSALKKCESLMSMEEYIDAMASADSEYEETLADNKEMVKIGNIIAKYLGVSSFRDIMVALKSMDFDTHDYAGSIEWFADIKGDLYKSDVLKYSMITGGESGFSYEKALFRGIKVVIGTEWSGEETIFFSRADMESPSP